MSRSLCVCLFGLLLAACGGSAFTSGSSASIDAGEFDALAVDEPADSADEPSSFADAASNRDAGAHELDAGGDAMAMIDAQREDARAEDASAPIESGAGDVDADAGPSCAPPTKQLLATYGGSQTLYGAGWPPACDCTPTCACVLAQTACDLASYPAPERPTSCNDQGSDLVLVCPAAP